MNKVATGIIMIIIALGLMAIPTVRKIKFTQNCKGYLKRAADANNIDIAKKELSKAIDYMEYKKLTTGYTSILYKTPNEDIGFWYSNIKASLNELNLMTEETTQLEKSNMLMKLRETLLDEGEKGTYVTIPKGIHKYPINGLFALLNTLAIGLLLLGIGMISYELDLLD